MRLKYFMWALGTVTVAIAADVSWTAPLALIGPDRPLMALAVTMIVFPLVTGYTIAGANSVLEDNHDT